MRFAPLVLLLVVEAAFAQTPDPKETPKDPGGPSRLKAAARKEPEGTSWKSKQVVSKLGAIRMKRVLMIDEDGNPVYEWFQGLQISYVVRDDQGNQVLLRASMESRAGGSEERFGSGQGGRVRTSRR